jgi:hypothetical protein
MMRKAGPLAIGLETTRQIRTRVSAAVLPIIAMTAHAMEQERQMCLAAAPKSLTRTLVRWISVPAGRV